MKTKSLPIVILAIVLASCAPASISTQAETPVPIAALTLTPVSPTLTITPVPPVESLPETQKSVGDFANAMQNAGKNIKAEQILQQGLTINEITGEGGIKYEIATTQDGYPLMLKSAGGGWKIPGYADLAPKDFIVGAGVDTWTGNFNDPLYKPLFESQYNLGMNDGTLAQGFFSGVPSNKLTPDEVISYYKWDDHKAITKFLQENKIPMGLMNLFPGPIFTTSNAPEWIKQFSNTELIEWIGKHMRSVADNTPNNNIKYVVLANEMFWHDPKTGWVGANGDYLYSRLGDDYIKTAYTEGKRIWPNAVLIFNDDTASGGIETNVALNSEALTEFNYVKKITAQGVPIEGFGLQSHLQARDFIDGNVQKNIDEYKAQLDKYMIMWGTIGVKFYITELDVNTGGLPDSMTAAQKEELKADIFSAVYDVCLSEDNCKGVTTQSFTDASSWLNDPNYPWKPGGPGLPFDKNYKPTLADYFILRSLFEADLARK